MYQRKRGHTQSWLGPLNVEDAWDICPGGSLLHSVVLIILGFSLSLEKKA